MFCCTDDVFRFYVQMDDSLRSQIRTTLAKLLNVLIRDLQLGYVVAPVYDSFKEFSTTEKNPSFKENLIQEIEYLKYSRT